MLNKILAFLRQYKMVSPGDSVICAVSGGADSMALLFGMYLLSEKLQISLAAAHYNHHLRGLESDADEAFVRQFCQQYQIPLYVGSGEIVAGEKGLEAAARDARYRFLCSLPGKIATAHTANDNAETVLMRLTRGTGLKGLGAIAPIRDNLIRPMLLITRQEVLAFLDEYHVLHVEDSSNASDLFLRNRLRHHIIPYIDEENPRFAENISAMALRLREDEMMLNALAEQHITTDIFKLRDMPQSLRDRVLSMYLQQCGVREPEAEHILLISKIVFSDKPSAKASFPDNVIIGRDYTHLKCVRDEPTLEQTLLSCPGVTEIPGLGIRVICDFATDKIDQEDRFTVKPVGRLVLRHRLTGDEMRRSGGTKSLKKIFIDRKIPASKRLLVPVVVDDQGVLGVYGIGRNHNREDIPEIEIRFETM